VMSISVCGSVCLSVCLSVCPQGYLRSHTRDLYQILCMLTVSVARSSSMFTIGRIACRRERVLFPIVMAFAPVLRHRRYSSRVVLVVYLLQEAVRTPRLQQVVGHLSGLRRAPRNRFRADLVRPVHRRSADGGRRSRNTDYHHTCTPTTTHRCTARVVRLL